jgi:hypothetical protein
MQGGASACSELHLQRQTRTDPLHLVLAASRRASLPLPSGATVVDRNRCPACCAVPRSSSLHRVTRLPLALRRPGL